MKLKTIYIDQKDLHLNDENVNVHSSKSIEKIAKSLKEFGFINPIVIDNDNIVIAGNGRLEAARRLKIDKIPCIRAEHLTEAQLKAYAIADNRVAEESFFDMELLSAEIEGLQDLIDTDSLGFDEDELMDILHSDIFDDDSNVIETKEKNDKETERMNPMLFEHQDFIVFKFDDVNDYVKCLTGLGIKKVDASLSPKVKKIGLGRVVDGTKLVELLGGKDES